VQSAMIISQEYNIIEHTSNQGRQMRRKLNRHTNLFTVASNNPIAQELEQVSKILDDANPDPLYFVYQGLVEAKRPDTGREGLRTGATLQYPEAIPASQL
jgi:hypothetical protein